LVIPALACVRNRKLAFNNPPIQAATAFTSDQRRSRAAKQVRDDIAGLAAVHECPLDELHWLPRRVSASSLRFGLIKSTS
jgi:hypothetical protein